ncbi:MAG: flagellar hook-length control protein FliK [Sutterellaceae bacterium]|nr:flagellar hook-length control protein FliK [Burkholderiaceae bacterium]MCX7902000.1 flagellar hook-length control protein FliK [Burkholderiaceae bacterium]MDW8430895.1 flagellar hook-length control protein FliK [Sutterellaceae bacterium]
MDVAALATASLRAPAGAERVERIAITLRALAPLLHSDLRVGQLGTELARALADATDRTPAVLILPLGPGPLRLEFGTHRFTLPSALRPTLLSLLGRAPSLPAPTASVAPAPSAAGADPALALSISGLIRDARRLMKPAAETAVPLMPAAASDAQPVASSMATASSVSTRLAREDSGEAVRFELLQQGTAAAADGAPPRVALSIGRERPRFAAAQAQPLFAARLTLELPPLATMRIAVRLSGDAVAVTIDVPPPVGEIVQAALPDLASGLQARGLRAVALALGAVR